jgi:hypothetical protein
MTRVAGDSDTPVAAPLPMGFPAGAVPWQSDGPSGWGCRGGHLTLGIAVDPRGVTP